MIYVNKFPKYELVKKENPDKGKRALRKLASDRIKSIDYVEVLP